MSQQKRGRRGIVARKFLRPEQIEDAIYEVATLAKDQRIHVLLAGGVAMQLYGSDRFTKDVDIISTDEIAGLRRTGRLTFGGVTTKTSENVPVDVILREDAYRPLFDAALDAPRTIRGVPIPVVSREYLAAMKMVARRAKDLEDLCFLVLGTTLSVPKTRALIVEYLGLYAGDEFDLFVQEVRLLGRCP